MKNKNIFSIESKAQRFQNYINNKIIIPPEFCICGNKKLTLNIYISNKKNGFCFRCTRHRCKKIYNVTKGSFFEEYKQKPIEENN
jgi:hypothetical protein